MYKFIFEDEDRPCPYGITDPYHTKRIEFQVRDNSNLDEMLDAFENFLKANGYNFDGNVDIVPEDSMELDPDKRDWQYDCEGNKVVKGDFTTLYKPKKKLWDATPEEWNQAYKNVTMKYKIGE
jgi:hypothetical protein